MPPVGAASPQSIGASNDPGVDNATPQLDKPSYSKPINDHFLRRLYVRACVWTGRRFQDSSRSILRISPNICVKYGSFRDLAEARTMQYLAERTSIPVPKIYCSFRRKDTTYIVMKRSKRKMLITTWHNLSDRSKSKVLSRLQEIIQEMRSLPSPNNKIAGVDGGSLWDCRLPSSLQRFGPFESTDEFHLFLRDNLEKNPEGFPDVDEMIALQGADWDPPVFTHGDLSTLNIIPRGDEIVEIIDWETAGWVSPLLGIYHGLSGQSKESILEGVY